MCLKFRSLIGSLSKTTYIIKSNVCDVISSPHGFIVCAVIVSGHKSMLFIASHCLSCIGGSLWPDVLRM
jgi:hypothetical protein